MTVTLGIATATGQLGVALGGPEGIVGSVSLQVGRRHGETLAPAIEDICRLAGIRPRSLDRVAVDVGPGLFTGLRVGVATAKAFGSALGVPVVPCSSLDLLAHPHRRCGRRVASVVDARRGEVFWALYEPVPGGMVAVTDPAVCSPDALPPLEGVIATGDGARRYLVGRAELAGEEFDHPSAAVLCDLAAARPALEAGKVAPLYLRGPDVRIGWDQR